MSMPPAVTRLNLTDLFLKRVRMQPDASALDDGRRVLSYADLEQRVQCWQKVLCRRGLQRGQRIALWSENRLEYIELQLAAARLGLIVACLNWRLQGSEQLHCIQLVQPSLLVVSGRYQDALAALPHGVAQVLSLDAAADELERAASHRSPRLDDDPEDGFLILYTSGTTGLPKGALISQRAIVARAQAFLCEFAITRQDGFIAWSPLYHMAATDHSMATLLVGGTVYIQDGFSAPAICQTLARAQIGWLMAMPGTIEPLIDALKTSACQVRGVRMVGAMADLVPRQQIAELTALLGAPYLNTFGSTETGLAPASGGLLAMGVPPASLSKREFGWCSVRLVNDSGDDVPDGTPGDMLVRGPSVFSGYWNGDRLEADCLADGWFHMGDMFVRNADGSVDFVDRSKYLIKSGGENVYPAEIERVLLAHPEVAEAVVVRKPDDRWGEVPVAFVALRGTPVPSETLREFCREHLASYKVPKEVHYLAETAFPRSSTGKIQKKQVERLLEDPR